MRRLFSLVLLLIPCFSASAALADPCAKDVAPLLSGLFTTLGRDCDAYASLFADDARYFHQHDGYKTRSELRRNCQAYAAFCPGKDCRFRQDGRAVTVARGESCEILVPYIWSETPANHRAPGNLEPHTGWEYIVASPDRGSRVGYRMKRFAELESTYSVAFNWVHPEQTPAVVAESALYLLSLKNSASRGECDQPLAPALTQFFADRSAGGDLWRQQGDAVVLAVGGLCHVAVPYSAQAGATLKSGRFVLTLQPSADHAYSILDAVEFPRSLH